MTTTRRLTSFTSARARRSATGLRGWALPALLAGVSLLVAAVPAADGIATLPSLAWQAALSLGEHCLYGLDLLRDEVVGFFEALLQLGAAI